MPKKNNEEQIESLDPILEEEVLQEETQPITEYEAICKISIKHNGLVYDIGDLIYLTNKSDYVRLLQLHAIE